jgi:hypothetical protein
LRTSAGYQGRSSFGKGTSSSILNGKKKVNFKSGFIEKLSNKENAVSRFRKSIAAPKSAPNTSPKLK